MKNKVSVVIVTRNRAKELKHCLGSLAGQSKTIDELIVVDNNSKDSTKKTIVNFKKSVQFPVKYVKHIRVGYPHVYNRGLKEARGEFIAFIDDDCVASPYWYSRIKSITSKLPRIAGIIGSSKEYFYKDVVALTKSYIDDIGKIGAIKNSLVVDHEIMDSKNIVYNKKFLEKHNIQFDSNLLKYAQGASEDCDLGMQIYSANGIVVFDDKMKITHKDPASIKAYFSKAIFTLRNHLVYERKWQNVRKNIFTNRPLSEKVKLLFKYKQIYNLSFHSFFLLVFNIIFSFIFFKLMRIFLRSEIESLDVTQISV